MTGVQLGLRANAGQFALLVGINALVGAMVGLERTVLPLIGEQDFGLTSKTAILTFIVAFGLTKAFTNLAAGLLWILTSIAVQPRLKMMHLLYGGGYGELLHVSPYAESPTASSITRLGA